MKSEGFCTAVWGSKGAGVKESCGSASRVGGDVDLRPVSVSQLVPNQYVHSD
jgi:hypothetical protein